MAASVDHAADFKAITDNLSLVTVQQVDPDTGVVGTTSDNVTAFGVDKDTATIAVGEGEVGSQTNDFKLVAAEIDFVPRARDRIVDADGVTWVIGDSQVAGFGSIVYAYNCVKMRTAV